MEMLNLRFINPKDTSVEMKEPSYEWTNVIIKFEVGFEKDIDAKNIIQSIKNNYIEDNLIAQYNYELQSIQAEVLKAQKQVTVKITAEKLDPKWGKQINTWT